MVVPAWSTLFVTALLAVASPAARPAALVIPGRFESVAASNDGVVAVSDGTVLVLDGNGYLKRRLWSPADPPTHPRRAVPSDGLAPLPGLTADSDWTDPVDPDVLDDPDDPRVADETEIRTGDLDEIDRWVRSRPLSEPRPRTVPAVAGASAFIGRGDGLWRVDLLDGRAVRTLPRTGSGIRAVAASASAQAATVALVAGGSLLRSGDGGETFTATTLLGAPRTLALSREGAVYLVDPDGLQVYPPDRSRPERLELARTIDVAPCETGGIALAGGELFSIAGGVDDRWRAEHVGPVPPGARRILCRPDGRLWVTYGEGLWTSRDRGQSWQARRDLPPTPSITSVAADETALWVATPSGLWRLPIQAPDTGDGFEEQPLPSSASRPISGTTPNSSRWWIAALPRVDVLLTVARSASRRDLRALIVLDFTLDRPPPMVWRHDVPADHGVRRDPTADLTWTAALPEAVNVSPADPVTIEERRALANALEDRP